MQQILEDQSGTLEVYPDSRPSSATITIFKPGGEELVASTAATVDSLSTTVASKTSDEVFVVASASGFVVGRKYLLIGAGGDSSPIEISEIDGTTITLAHPPAIPVAVSDSIVGLRVSYTLASSKTGERDLYYRAEWLVTPTSGDVQGIQSTFDVVRMQFTDPCTSDTVKRYLSFQFPSAISRYSSEELNNIAERASNMVTRAVDSIGRRAHLYGSPEMFTEAGLIAMKIVLADDGLIPQAGQLDVLEYLENLRRSFKSHVHQATQSGWYDKDDDGVVETGEKGNWSTRVVL